MEGKEMEEGIEKDMTPRLVGEPYKRRTSGESTTLRLYALYECQYCKNTFETMVQSVKAGITKSCGCLVGKNMTHGFSYHKFCQTWYDMKHRCYNIKREDYKYYGARGITVCEEWLDVSNFVAWCDLTHPNISGVSLDRIDVNGNYEPSNCRWADASTQASNKSKQINSTSGYTGVNWNRTRGLWVAVLVYNSKRSKIGVFKTIEEAVQARDNYIIENNLPHKLSTDYKREDS